LDTYFEEKKYSFAVTSRTFFLYALVHTYVAELLFEQIPAKANPLIFFDAVRKAALTSSLVLSLTFLERLFFDADILGLSVDFKNPLKAFNAGPMSSLSPIGIAILPLIVYAALWNGLTVIELTYSAASTYLNFAVLHMARHLLFFIKSEPQLNYANGTDHCAWWPDNRGSLWSPFFTQPATEPVTLRTTTPASSPVATGDRCQGQPGIAKHASSSKYAENSIFNAKVRAPPNPSDNGALSDKNPQPVPTIDTSIARDKDKRRSSRYHLLFYIICQILLFVLTEFYYPEPIARIINIARVALLFLNNFLPLVRGEGVPVSDFSGVSRVLYVIWGLVTSLLPFTLPQIRVPGWLSKEKIDFWFFHTALAGIILVLGPTDSAMEEHVSSLKSEHFEEIWSHAGIWTKFTAYLLLTIWIISVFASEKLLVSLAYLQGQAKYIFWDMYVLNKMPSPDDASSLMYPWDTWEMIIKDYEECPELSSPDHTRFPTLLGSLLLMQLRWPGFPSLIAVLVIWLLLKMKALHDTLWYRFQKLVIEIEGSDDEDGYDELDILNLDSNSIDPLQKRERKPPPTHERWFELLTRFYTRGARKVSPDLTANDEAEAAQIVELEKKRIKARAQVADHRAAKERVAAANDRFRARSRNLEANLIELRGNKSREGSQSDLIDLKRDLEAEAEAEIEALRKTRKGTTSTPDTITDDIRGVPEGDKAKKSSLSPSPP
jgi:hypothetical protein